MVNEENVSLNNMICYHMDENLDWEGKLTLGKRPQQLRIYAPLFLRRCVPSSGQGGKPPLSDSLQLR